MTKAINLTGLQTFKNTFVDNKIPVAEKGANGGVATLDQNGKVPSSQIPAIAITETIVATTEQEMLNSLASKGYVCIRTDLNKTFILSNEPATLLANWQEILTPATGVLSFNGNVGHVTVPKAGITEDGLMAKEDKAKLDNHTNDTTIHVTQADKNNWDNKLDASDLEFATNDEITALL